MEEKEPKKKKIKSRIAIILSVLVFVLSLTIIIKVVVANTQHKLPSIFGFSVSYVPTESMEPTIYSDQYILSQTTTFDKVNIDDIIIYRSNTENRFIVHRVIEKYEDYLITKGDNNPIADSEHITSDMVCGKYITTIGFLSIFSGGVNSTVVYVILVVLFVILIITQGFSIYIKYKADKIKKQNELRNKQALEELRQEIYKEELEKLKNNKNN